jgi:hypothetical protein
MDPKPHSAFHALEAMKKELDLGDSGTLLEAGRSRVRDTMRKINFFQFA